MKIAIIGSWREHDREWGLCGNHAEFERACYSLGHEFARHHQILVVSGESVSTADLHVVRGVVDAIGGRTVPHPLIEVVRPADDVVSYEELVLANPGLFAFHSSMQARWASADVVIAIAGMTGTYHGGLAAIVAGKKLVLIASFGGASAKLSASLETLGELRKESNCRLFNGPWTSQSIDTVVRLTGVGVPPKVLLIHGRSTDWLRVKDWLREKARIPEVVVMQQEFGSGRTVLEKFEQLASRVDKAIAIATPDDLGGLWGSEPSSFRHRARQNVWLEVGWFWGRLGRNRVFVLSKGDIEFPSDLTGLEIYSYQDDPAERSDKLRVFLGID